MRVYTQVLSEKNVHRGTIYSDPYDRILNSAVILKQREVVSDKMLHLRITLHDFFHCKTTLIAYSVFMHCFWVTRDGNRTEPHAR